MACQVSFMTNLEEIMRHCMRSAGFARQSACMPAPLAKKKKQCYADAIDAHIYLKFRSYFVYQRFNVQKLCILLTKCN
jgi:hypothetical protein